MNNAVRSLIMVSLIGYQDFQLSNESQKQIPENPEQEIQPELSCQPGSCPRDLYAPYQAFVKPTHEVTSVLAQRYGSMGDTIDDFASVELQSGDPNDLRYWNLVVTTTDGHTAAMQMLVVNNFEQTNDAGPPSQPWLVVRSFAWVTDDTASVEVCMKDHVGISNCRTFESTYE